MATPPITDVSVVSTGTVRLHPQQIRGSRAPMLLWVNTSRTWTEPLPINVFVVEHRDGLILFDLGQDRRSVTDPGYFPGGVAGGIYRRLARVDVPPDATLSARLRSRGYDIADVRVAVVSHLHQDHIGGLGELPSGTRVLVSEVELDIARQKNAEVMGVMPRHVFVDGVTWTPVGFSPSADPRIAPFDRAFDVMGDGSLVLLPTPGHTAGSMSMLVDGEGFPRILLVGDLAYDARDLVARRLPGMGDRAALAATYDRIDALRIAHPDLTVLATHDPAAAASLADALATRSDPGADRG